MRPKTPRNHWLKETPELLESRCLLSGVSQQIAHLAAAAPDASPMAITFQLDPAAAPAGGNTVFSPRVVVEGQTTPGAAVRLFWRGVSEPVQKTTANTKGLYQFNVRMDGRTTASLQVVATGADGGKASASLTVSRPNMVIAWNAVALQAIRNTKTPPPNASRALAITQVSVFDAVNAIVPTTRSYEITVPRVPCASAQAATASAAYTSLLALFPGQKALFDAALDASISGIGTGPARDKGLALGRSVAEQIVALRSNDGSNATVNYVPGSGVGQWQPTPPAYAKALDPQWGQVTPFALVSGSQFLPGAPPSVTSAEFTAAYNQVLSVGAANSTTRTVDQTQIALFWNDPGGTSTPPGHWNEIAANFSVKQHDSLTRSARVFALLDIAEADAGIACWNAKFTYNYWRPVTAIHDAAASGNPQLTPDPTFKSLIVTPPFPSYMSGHSTFSAAAATVLSSLYGSHSAFTATSDGLPGVTRSYTSFSQAAQEAGMSRIYGGIHYMFDNVEGLVCGQKVGQYVMAHVLQTGGVSR